MTANQKATTLLLAESFWLLPLVGCRTRRSVLGLMLSSGRDTVLRQSTLSDVGCVVSGVAVNVSCHVAVRICPRALSSGLGTGNGGVNNNNNNNM